MSYVIGRTLFYPGQLG